MVVGEPAVDEFGLPEKVAFGDEETISRLDRLFRIAWDCYNLGGPRLNVTAYLMFERLARVEGDGVPPGLLTVSRSMEKILNPDTHPTVAAIYALEFLQPRVLHIRQTDDAGKPDTGNV